jgi:NADP-dependent 3-hydroxy acid dehydrogenase YdfG
VADRQAVLAGAEQVRQDLQSAWILINDAGVDLYAGIAEMSWSDVDWLIGINVGGVVNGTKAFLPQLIESGQERTPAPGPTSGGDQGDVRGLLLHLSDPLPRRPG